MKRVFSGIQPSGHLTIANYAGAIRNWTVEQSRADCLFCIVDLHTLTVPRDPDALRERCYEFLALYLACGIDPDQSAVFLQSHNQDHVELAWILSCIASVGQLGRMTQYKEKTSSTTSNAGLLCYPVLMAADILLYDTDEVPVGDDQVQHVELTRDLAERFNSRIAPVFNVPSVRTAKNGARVRNLIEPTRKMDKSNPNAKTYIALLDPPDVVRAKVRSAATSSRPDYDLSDRNPGIANLVSLMGVATGEDPTDIACRYEGTGFAQFKSDLAEAIVEMLRPIQEEYRRVTGDRAGLDTILRTGADRARSISTPKLADVRRAIGLPRQVVGDSAALGARDS